MNQLPSNNEDVNQGENSDISDNRPSNIQGVRSGLERNRQPVTTGLIIITVFVYLFQIGSQYLFGVDLPAAFGMKVNSLILSGEFWRLITPTFLHGSIIHLGFNMYALSLLGPGLEIRFGKKRFVSLYILAGFSGNVISMMFTKEPSLGSSTAIFGLLGAQGVYIFQNRKMLGGIARNALNRIVMIAGINFLIGMNPGIDNWGHFGGLVGGALFTWLGGPILILKAETTATLRAVDSRRKKDILIAGIVVAGFFSFLVLGVLIMQNR